MPTVEGCTLGKHPESGCACGYYADKQCCDQHPCKLHKCGKRKGCFCPLPETEKIMPSVAAPKMECCEGMKEARDHGYVQEGSARYPGYEGSNEGIIHSCSSGNFLITHCPWCGKKLE